MTQATSTTISPKSYKIEMINDDGQISIASDDDDDDLISSDGSLYDTDLMQIQAQDDVANQLAAAGPVGVAAAAAITSSKKRKRPHSFETNPSVRKRQQNRLLRKLRAIIYEFTGRVGKQAVVLVATPGKPNTSYKVFGAKPLEDVMRNLKNIVMDELENALAQQAPPPPQEDPSLFELPPLIIDGIPTPVEKMTQAQLRAFIPLMLKYSTGRGKPGWGRESTRPPWWPKELPWANVRMDARSEDDKQKISWTHALRKIVINCYKYHGREDLLPTFADEDDKVAQLISQTGEDDEDDDEDSNPAGTLQTVPTITNTNSTSSGLNIVKINSSGTVITTHNPNAQSNSNPSSTIIQRVNNNQVNTTTTLPASTKIEISTAPISQSSQQANTDVAQTIANAQVCIEPMAINDIDYSTQTVLSTIQNADGTVSLIQVDPNNPIITLPDGTTAQVQGVATLHQSENGATIQTVQGLTDINGHDNMTVDLTEVAQDGQIYIASEDGQGYPISVSNMITVPVSTSIYQSMMANIQQIHSNGDGTVCITPMQVHSNRNVNNGNNNNNNCTSNTKSSVNQCYSMVPMNMSNATAHIINNGNQAASLNSVKALKDSTFLFAKCNNYTNKSNCQEFNQNNLSNDSSQRMAIKTSIANDFYTNQRNITFYNHRHDKSSRENNKHSSRSTIVSLPIILAATSCKRNTVSPLNNSFAHMPKSRTQSKAKCSLLSNKSGTVLSGKKKTGQHKRQKRVLTASVVDSVDLNSGSDGDLCSALAAKVIKLENIEN